jgi:NitT/TauT family transport system substrate-binding protein
MIRLHQLIIEIVTFTLFTLIFYGANIGPSKAADIPTNAADSIESSPNNSSGLKLEIPYNALATNMLPLWTAVDNGLFDKYGVNVTTEYSSHSPALVASILSGETPFAIVNQDPIIAADLHGGDIVILVSGTEKLFFAIFASSKIKTVADLKGKTIGITSYGTTSDFIAQYVLKTVGLEAGKDANLVPMGSPITRHNGILTGQIDAAVGTPVEFGHLGMDSLHIVADLLDYDLFFYTGSLVAKKSWVIAHHNDALNVVRGYVAGIAAVHTNKKAAIASLSKYTKLTDQQQLENGYDSLLKVLLKDPTPKASVIQSALDTSTLPEAKNANAANFVDPSFVEQLKKDGFIDQLYQ